MMTNIQNMSYNIKDYMLTIPDFLDQSTCKDIVKKTSKLNWHSHGYYDVEKNKNIYYDNELSVLHTNIPEIERLNEKLGYALKLYLEKLNLPWYNSYHGYTKVRMNKYTKNTVMRLHCDHIHSIFDGETKGVPILTMLGSLNNNYKGGELVMFNSEVVELKAGSLLIFPSNFLYPHEVLPVKEGTRYSFVSWSW